MIYDLSTAPDTPTTLPPRSLDPMTTPPRSKHPLTDSLYSTADPAAGGVEIRVALQMFAKAEALG